MKLRWLLVPIVLIGGSAYALKQYVFVSACSQPLGYRLGAIDPRFKLTQAEVLADTQQASAIWNRAAGKTLLQYDPNAKLTVDLSYDQRQALQTQISQLNGQLQQGQGSLASRVANYQQQLKSFKDRMAQLNTDIDYWNQRGGAPPDIYKNLVSQQQALQQQSTQLNQIAEALNLSTDQYNSAVNTLNKTVGTFNQALQTRPEEGLYQSTGPLISIFLVNSQPELVHTLAHEMGHALGLNHVDDPKAVMYAYTSEVVALSPADQAALDQECQVPTVQTLFERLRSRLPNLPNWWPGNQASS